jgi:4-amino-4-deoxy-L-arabinose transferase-like glycosyltransferase
MRVYLKKPLSLLIIAVVLVSGAYSFYYQDRPRVDAQAYDKIGWNLARGLGYIEDERHADMPEEDDAIVRVGPGYEFFLAGIYSIVGHKIWVVWILHAFLRGASVFLVYVIARQVFRRGPPMSGIDEQSSHAHTIGMIAATLFGFSPDLIVINGLLLTETLFLFLLLLSVYATFWLFHEEEVCMSRKALYGGFFWALTILTRPIAAVPLLIVFGILFWRRNIMQGIAVVVFPVLLVGSWAAVMTARYDHFVLTTTAGWYDMWVGNNPEAEGGFIKTPEIQAFRDQNYDSTVLDKVGREKYFEFLTEQPFSFLELQWRKSSMYGSLMRPGGYWIHLYARPWHLRATLGASAIGTALLFIGGIAGGLLAWILRRKEFSMRLFLAFAIVQPLVVIPIIVETRYRYALFPFLAILTAYFSVSYIKNLVPRKLLYQTIGIALGMVLIFTGYDLWYNWEDITSKIQRVI